MATPTYAQQAANLQLWNEYFNTDGAMTDAEFDSMTVDAKIALLVAAYGPETTDASNA